MKSVQRKVCMLGSFAVGKTSLVRRFVKGRFDEKYLSTIGVQISRRSIMVDERNVNLIIWDLAGGDEFIRSNAGYLRGASGVFLVCDLTREPTLAVLEQYAEQIRSADSKMEIVVLGNKHDLTEERIISDEELAAFCKTVDAPYFLTSAKTGENIAEAFNLLGQKIA